MPAEGEFSRHTEPPEAIAHPPAFPTPRVDYPGAIAYKMPLLVKSFQRFKAHHPQAYPEEFYAFCQQHAFWLDDFALFMALKEVHRGAKIIEAAAR